MKGNAREAALQVLRRVQLNRAFADLALNAALQQNELSPVDRHLATELVYGVLRHRAYLDWLLGCFSHREIGTLEQRVVDALRLGVYQLVFLDRVPDHAAINESVALAPRRAAGLVNAVLRSVQRRERLPQPGRGLSRLEAAAIRHSHPLWMLREWEEQFGLETACGIAAANQQTPPAVVRINPIKTTREKLLADLADLDPQPAKNAPGGILLTRLDSALNHPLFAEGHFLVQSEASQIVAELTGARVGERVWDCCAAPGGKATHLAALVGPTGQVVASDLHPQRLRLIRANCRRLGAVNVLVCKHDAASGSPVGMPAELFDRVLVDAPCSSLGTLAKQPEIKWNLGPSDPQRLAETQLEICRTAAEFVRPGGVLLYSVCTLTRAETDSVVRRFLQARKDFRLDDLHLDFGSRYDPFLQQDGTFLSLPSRNGTEGMFAARMIKELT